MYWGVQAGEKKPELNIYNLLIARRTKKKTQQTK
jgi:hypothetical protein